MLKIFTLLADFVVYKLLQGTPQEKGAEAMHFFIEDVSKIFFLLTLMIYVISWLRAGLDTEKVRLFLSGRKRGVAYFVASGFGAVTPFCSCSSIPLFLGFTSAKIPLGITMAFLITSPMINEVALILLGTLLGLPFMLIYLAIGILSGVIGGWFLDKIGAEKYLTELGDKALEMNVQQQEQVSFKLTLNQRHTFALQEWKSIFKRVWIWVIVGVGAGAMLHGFIPEDFFLKHMGEGQWWTVPLSVLMGIPLYANASGVIPVVETLINKGVPIGTAMAFMMSVVAASLPEFTMLRQVMKPRLLLWFFLILLFFFTLAGWILNILF